jgi:ABC-type transport system involved in cytochrome c biogenesis permease subunit
VRAAGALFLLGGAVLALGGGRSVVQLRASTAGGTLVALLLAGWRSGQVGHLPLAGLHETLLVFGVCLTLVAGPPAVACRLPRLLGLCLAGAGVLWLLSSFAPSGPTPLVPALRTIWFEVHVVSSFVAYACFGLSAAAASLCLFGRGDGAEARVVRAGNAWGFAWFTWAMVSGGIWAYLAWGAYWLWHVKELWSAIVWTFYAGMVHLPHLPGWKATRQSAWSIVGFALVMFTYLGVGLLMRNTHRF